MTHDIPRGLRLADRAAIFAQGRIVLEERATDLSTERVEEAIG